MRIGNKVRLEASALDGLWCCADLDFAPQGAVVTFRDVGGHKSAEHELQIHLQELERFNELAVACELRMIDLEQEVNGLLGEMGRKTKDRPEDPDKPEMKPADGGADHE